MLPPWELEPAKAERSEEAASAYDAVQDKGCCGCQRMAPSSQRL